LTRSLITLLTAIALSPLAAAQTPHIDPATPPANLTPLPFSIGGRVLIQDDASQPSFGAKLYTFQWPGTYFEAAFNGTEVYFRVGSGKQHLHVNVDQQPTLILTQPATGVYLLSGLTPGKHTVRITVVSETASNAENFGGFALLPSEKAVALKPRTRQIEFIGDSYTVGAGNTSPGPDCTADEIWSYTDNSKAYGALTALHYDADYQVNAISGRGMARNYNGGHSDTVPVVYPFVLFDKKTPYHDPTWQPRVIVISLGTNDFTTKLHDGEPWKTRDDQQTAYEDTYIRFLKMLRANNPKAFLIVWATGSAEIQSEASTVVDKFKMLGETRIAYLSVPDLKRDACLTHPNTADNEIVSKKLIQLIDQTPGIWQTTP
jgi:lysophospholipase L1-like esterase